MKGLQQMELQVDKQRKTICLEHALQIASCITFDSSTTLCAGTYSLFCAQESADRLVFAGES
jgi:hypothetical protein